MAFSFRFHKLSFMDFVTWTFLLISLLFLICNLLNTLVFPVVAYLVYLRVCIFYPVVLGPLALRLERWKMLMLLPKLLSIPLVRNHVRYADALCVSPIPSDAGSPIMEILLFLTMTMPSFWEKNASFSGSTFEWDNFHPHNTLPDRPCTAFFFLPETDVSTQELHSHGINAGHFCQMSSKKSCWPLLYYIFYWSRRNCFRKKSFLVARRKASNFHLMPSSRHTFVGDYGAPFELPNEAIAHCHEIFGKIEYHRRSFYHLKSSWHL